MYSIRGTEDGVLLLDFLTLRSRERQRRDFLWGYTGRLHDSNRRQWMDLSLGTYGHPRYTVRTPPTDSICRRYTSSNSQPDETTADAQPAISELDI